MQFSTFQLFGNDNIIGNIIWFLFIFGMIFVYPRMMITQMIWKLEQTASMLEGFTVSARRIVVRKITSSPTKEIRDAISNFLDFFVIEPVSLDPYGIVQRIEHVSNLSEKRFNYFVRNIAPKLDSESQANIVMGLSGAISLNQLHKIIRHFIGLIKKTRNLQLAMILQMQMPLVERISKALMKGTEALSNGWPIGDAAGPIAATYMIDESKVKATDDDIVVARKKIKGKNVDVIKAKGPGGRLGKLGKAVEGRVRRQKTAKIITIDAAAKLEGEKTGSVAEGIGVAIGGIGVDRAYIEKIATEREIPLDSYVIKMSQEEAIMPIKLEVINAVPKVIKAVEDNISKTREKGSIIVVGVGNTAGIGNNKKDFEKAMSLIKRNAQALKQWEEEEKKKEKKWYDFFSGGF